MTKSNRTPRSSRLLITSAVIAGLVLSPLLLDPPPAQATFPGYTGKIYFQTNRDGNYEIYVMNADGSAQTRLTTNSALDMEAAPSPDGTKITFSSDRDGNNEIYVMDADGSNAARLTNHSASDTSPVWSPDGTKIAFHSNRSGSNQVWVIDADGGNPVNLSNDPVAAITPDWSPDGSQIVYRSARAGGANPDIYVMAADGSQQTQLTNFVGFENNPSWSPDGQHILFARRLDATNYTIFSMNLSDGSEVQLTEPGQNNFHPRYSPDGTKIAFTSVRDGNRQVYVMNADGSNQSRLTTDATAVEEYPGWQPIPNTAPVATSDTTTAAQNTATSASVLANDTDEEALSGANLTITVQPSHGTATVNAGAGTINYTPENGYLGPDSLTYQICDSFVLDQKCATAVLGITLQAAPPPDTTAPTKPTITRVGTVQVNGAITVYYTGHRPTFSGTAEAGATITVIINSDPIILTTTADGSGNWSVIPDQDIPDGEHTVTVTATDAAGNVSEPLTFVLGINVGTVPSTGVDTGLVRFWGIALLAAGAGLHLRHCRTRRNYDHVPQLFPQN